MIRCGRNVCVRVVLSSCNGNTLVRRQPIGRSHFDDRQVLDSCNRKRGAELKLERNSAGSGVLLLGPSIVILRAEALQVEVLSPSRAGLAAGAAKRRTSRAVAHFLHLTVRANPGIAPIEHPYSSKGNQGPNCRSIGLWRQPLLFVPHRHHFDWLALGVHSVHGQSQSLAVFRDRCQIGH